LGIVIDLSHVGHQTSLDAIEVSRDPVGVGTDRWMRPTLAYKLVRTEFERTLPGFFGEYSGEEKHVAGFNYYDEWESLVDHLLRRNFSDAQIEKILGGSFCRVFRQVWEKGKQLALAG